MLLMPVCSVAPPVYSAKLPGVVWHWAQGALVGMWVAGLVVTLLKSPTAKPV